MGGSGTSAASITGNDVICGGKPTKKAETDCLRKALDVSPYAATKKEGQKTGYYGCGNDDRSKHTACLRAILHQGDNTLAPGTN